MHLTRWRALPATTVTLRGPTPATQRRGAAPAARQATATATATMAAGAGCRVAVVGAGAAGLAAARMLLREGHTPVLYEQAPHLGGVWVYSEDTDACPLGSDDPARRAHGSM